MARAARELSGARLATLSTPSKLTVPEVVPEPDFASVKLLVSTVVAKISSLKVAVRVLFRATAVAPLRGEVLVTVGAVVSLVSPVAPDDDPPLQADRKSGANNDRHRGHRVAVVLSMFIVFSPCACGNFVLFFYCC